MKCPNCGHETGSFNPVRFDIPVGNRSVKAEGYSTRSSFSFYLKGETWEDVDQAIQIIMNNEMLKSFRKSVERYFEHNTASVIIDMYGI